MLDAFQFGQSIRSQFLFGRRRRLHYGIFDIIVRGVLHNCGIDGRWGIMICCRVGAVVVGNDNFQRVARRRPVTMMIVMIRRRHHVNIFLDVEAQNTGVSLRITLTNVIGGGLYLVGRDAAHQDDSAHQDGKQDRHHDKGANRRSA
eukprot:scaffold381_cov178-Amphora_coffeaeformis.AAC.2